jgi:diguanylate cyclase (GGDEF)-like protein/PAS domain S-box-containing protein
MVFINWMTFAGKTTKMMSEDMNHDISQQIDVLINMPYRNNEVNQKLISSGVVDLSEEGTRETFFACILQSLDKEVYSFSYGTESGEYYGARRNDNGIIEVMKNNKETSGHTWYYSVNEDMSADQIIMKTEPYDPRSRDWYRVAKNSGEPIYSSVYKHFIMNDLAISAALPIYNENGLLQGVLGTHILLSGIDNFLSDIVGNKDGFALIIDMNTEELIGNSFNEANFIIQEDGLIKRYKLEDIGTPDMKEGYEQYKNNPNELFLYNGDKENYYFNVMEYHKNGLDWLLISAIPSSFFMDDIVINIYSTVLIMLIAILISFIVYYISTKKLMKPLGNLIIAMEQLSSGELSKRVPISKYNEIGKIAMMFNKMADKMNHLVNNLETTVQERTSDLIKANDALKTTQDELYLILDSTAEGIFGLDTDGNCTFCNDRCIELLGYKHQEDLVGKNMHLQIHHSYRDGKPMPMEDCKIINTLSEGAMVHVFDEVYWRADGSCFDVEYYSYPQLKDGKLIGSVVTFMDITERKKNEEQIQYLSCHDPLTGVMNRRCFEEVIKKCDVKTNLPISVIFADLNGLKLVNDIFGHASGDILIQKSAEILKESCRGSDVIARVGGDEFVIMLPKTDTNEAEGIVEKIRTYLSIEKVNGIKCSMALGVDTKVSSYQNIENIMRNAESEMYKEKTLSRKKFANEALSTIINLLQERSKNEKIHSENVAVLCERMGRAMGLSVTEIKKLHDSGYMHDIGKIVLEDSILSKEENWTKNEEQLVMQHSVIGYRILNIFDDTLDLADDVYAHHEKWDGSGYPKGLKGDEIPMKARIIALVESYDRKLAKVKEVNSEAIERILLEIREGSGKLFDPKLTEVFIDMIRKQKL